MQVPLIDLSDLIIAKILAGRAKDIDDATALWRLHRSRLDDAYITKTLRLLEQALGQSDLVSAFDSIAR